MNEICRRQWQIYDSDSFVNWCVFIMSNKLCNLTSYYHHMHNIPYHIISFITYHFISKNSSGCHQYEYRSDRRYWQRHRDHGGGFQPEAMPQYFTLKPWAKTLFWKLENKQWQIEYRKVTTFAKASDVWLDCVEFAIELNRLWNIIWIRRGGVQNHTVSHTGPYGKLA